MTLITKPDFTYVWASGGAVVAPNDAKKQQGWVAEAPPFQYDNWLQNRQDQMLAHINQRGIPAWDGNTEYEAAGLSYVQGNNGLVYKSVAASGPATTIQDPTTDVSDTYWTVAFADIGAFLTQAAGDARYAQLANNLSDLTNTATARNNLSVYSKLESDNFGINSTRIDVASASTVNLTTSAPNTRHINITGTTAITGFTVAAGQCYFVRFNASLILTNGASLVTQSGANIAAKAGDTCIIRATATNVVEILCYRNAKVIFESAQVPMVIGGAATLAHGLGEQPNMIELDAICLVAVAGYAIGDVIKLSPQVDNSRGVQITGKDATNIYLKFGSADVGLMLNKTTGSSAPMVASNWALIVRAGLWK